MSTIVLRSVKGTPLTNTEVDDNFSNLNTDKVEKTAAAITGGSINGTTVGATTASTGAFTTLTTSSTVTHNGGTANGVAYLNGSKVLTTGSALTFNGTNTFTVSPATGTAYNRTESAQYSTWLQTGAGNANVFWEFSAGTPLRWVDTSAGELMRLTSTGLGIGTSNPTSALTVGAGGAARFNRADNNTFNEIKYVSAGDLFYFNQDNGGAYQFNISGSEQMRLTSTGLGLGTSSPAAKLDIAGLASNTPAAIFRAAAGVGNAGGLGLYATDANANARNWYVVSNSTSYGDLNIKVGTSQGADPTSGTIVATFSSSGNLGLGVTPSNAYANSRAFEIGANGIIWTENASSIYNSLATGLNFYYNAAGDIKYKSTGVAASRYTQYQGSHYWYSAPSGTAGDTITFTQAMTLDASGNLGVGTTSPSNTIQAKRNGTTDASNSQFISENRSGASGQYALYGTRFDDGSGSGFTPVAFGGIQTAAAGRTAAFIIAVSDTDNIDLAADERLRITSAGNVGIGTSSPANPTGGKGFEISSASGASIRATNSATYLELQSGGSANYILSNGAYPLLFYTNGSERMRLDASGNLGLGVTPSAWRTVGGEKVLQIDTASVYCNSGNDVYVNSNWFLNSSAQSIYLESDFASSYAQANGQHLWYNAPSGNAGDPITFTQAMTLSAAGNLGVGTSSPATKLNLSGTSAQTLMVSNTSTSLVTDDSMGTLDFAAGTSNTTNARVSGLVVGTSEAGGTLSFETRADGGSLTEKARMPSTGGLLVGTTTTASSISNIAPLVGGKIYSFYGEESTLDSGTARTLFTLTADYATYIVSCSGIASSVLYSETAIVMINNTSVQTTVIADGAVCSISNSGLNVQYTQSSGVSMGTVIWSATRIL